MNCPDFQKFPKIARLSREALLTEKIDGTNAQVLVTEEGLVFPGSRNRWLSDEKGKDNFGFAAWTVEHHDELLELGPGRHFGEWYGLGIQRNYGLDHRRFALFNVSRWNEENPPPTCCETVPVLWRGLMGDATYELTLAMNGLRVHGSTAAPWFMDPEGIVLYHTAANIYFKKTFENDAVGKRE